MSEHEKFADDLPLLALGALEGAERDAVEAHARSCDHCSRELQRLNEDLAMLALTTSLQSPPERAKARLMSAVAKEPKAAALKAQSRQGRWWMLVPSAVALGLMLLVIALLMQNRALQRDLTAAIRAEQQQHEMAARSAQVVRLLTDRDAMHVTLVATNSKPQPIGRTIYSPKSGGLVFFASNFAPVPQDKAYELWLIPQQGAPMPAGVFKPDASGNGMIMMPPMTKGMQPKAFAITIERAEGATTPTMPIVLMGQSG